MTLETITHNMRHVLFVYERLARNATREGLREKFIWGDEWTALADMQFSLAEQLLSDMKNNGKKASLALVRSFGKGIVENPFSLAYIPSLDVLAVSEISLPYLHLFRDGDHLDTLREEAFTKAYCCPAKNGMWAAGSKTFRLTRLDSNLRIAESFELGRYGVTDANTNQLVHCHEYGETIYLTADSNKKRTPRYLASFRLGDPSRKLRLHNTDTLLLPRQFIEFADGGLGICDSWFPSIARRNPKTGDFTTTFRTALPKNAKGYAFAGEYTIIATNGFLCLCTGKGNVVDALRIGSGESVRHMAPTSPGRCAVLDMDGPAVVEFQMEYKGALRMDLETPEKK